MTNLIDLKKERNVAPKIKIQLSLCTIFVVTTVICLYCFFCLDRINHSVTVTSSADPDSGGFYLQKGNAIDVYIKREGAYSKHVENVAITKVVKRYPDTLILLVNYEQKKILESRKNEGYFFAIVPLMPVETEKGTQLIKDKTKVPGTENETDTVKNRVQISPNDLSTFLRLAIVRAFLMRCLQHPPRGWHSRNVAG